MVEKSALPVSAPGPANDADDSHKVGAGIFIKSLTFKGGSILQLQDDSIVVFVGPNNSGKSLTLREIHQHLSEREFTGRSIANIELQRVGNENALIDRLAIFRGKKDKNFLFSSSDYKSISEGEAQKLWKSDDRYVGGLVEFFVTHLTTEKRLADCEPAEMVDSRERNRGTHPIQNLALDSDLEILVSNLFRRAFATDLVVYRGAGRTIPLYAGERPVLGSGENLASRTYLDKIEKLEPLEEQGDGLRSFASVLLRVWTGHHSILLLDEPEAFLHPPQARAVGELISSSSEHEKQIFIATHSNDVIQGLLNRYPGRVSVVRLSRAQGGSTATFLPSDRISDLWRDPILRYSNVLNGLFHSRVVVTESDGDCKFYEAISEIQLQSLKTTFYTYAGGKHRVPTIVRSLRALHVPVRTVVDFDIFADDGSIRNLIEAHGLPWSDFDKDVAQIRKVIQSRKGWLIGSSFKARVFGILAEVEDNSIVQKNLLKRIEAAMKEASPWDYVKSAGMAAIPSGDPTKLLQSLMERLRRADIFVVPEGELEGFCRSVGGHGPKWVEAVLTRDLANDEELAKARTFVKELNTDSDNYLSSQRREVISPKRYSARDFFQVESTFNLIMGSVKNAAKTLGWIAFVCYWALQVAILLTRKP